MKQGFKSIEALYNELDRQRNARQDLIADTRSLSVKTTNGNTKINVATDNEVLTFGVNELAHKQIATRLQIPWGYYERMRQSEGRLLDYNINHWLYNNPEQRMLRVLDGNLRAFVSSRYRRLDNLELLDHTLPVIAKMKGAQIMSCDVTETHMYLKVVNKSMKSQIDVGDIVYAGFVVSNSEVSCGSCKLENLIWRKVCSNGLISPDFSHKKYHIGKQTEATDSAYELYSDETLAADDKAYFMKVQDLVSVAVDEAKFNLVVDKMKHAKSSIYADPIKTVEIMADRYVLNKTERASVLRHFLMDRDYSHYGLVNSLTAAAQENPDYNRSTDMERMGGLLLEEGVKAIGNKGSLLLPATA